MCEKASMRNGGGQGILGILHEYQPLTKCFFSAKLAGKMVLVRADITKIEFLNPNRSAINPYTRGAPIVPVWFVV